MPCGRTVQRRHCTLSSCGGRCACLSFQGSHRQPARSPVWAIALCAQVSPRRTRGRAVPWDETTSSSDATPERTVRTDATSHGRRGTLEILLLNTSRVMFTHFPVDVSQSSCVLAWLVLFLCLPSFEVAHFVYFAQTATVPYRTVQVHRAVTNSTMLTWNRVPNLLRHIGAGDLERERISRRLIARSQLCATCCFAL